MDRFIVMGYIMLAIPVGSLKSNMDRFIGICLNMFMDFCGL